MPPPPLANNSDAAIVEVAQWFVEGYIQTEAYSSVQMVDYVAQLNKIDIQDVFKTPGILKQRFDLNTFNYQNMGKHLSNFSYQYSGRCTSFAFKIAKALEKYYYPVFEFEFYDVGRHRLARCKNTGLVIDSSSEEGAFILPNGGKNTNEKGRVWTYSTQGSVWKNVNSAGKPLEPGRSDIPLTPRLAMGKCFAEIAQDVPGVTLFRSHSDGRTQYHGIISWDLKKRRLTLSSSVGTTGRSYVLKWAGKGKQSPLRDIEKAVHTLAYFIVEYGGPLARKQWQCGGLDKVQLKWMACAFSQWGPVEFFGVGDIEKPLQ